MPNYNKVILLGNLTRDPQTKCLPSNMTIAEFGLAVNRKFRTAAGEDREEVAFIDCTAFGKQAEVISQYCQKGKQLFVEGRLKYDTWDDKAGNGKRSKLTVVVENFQFMGGRDRDGVDESTDQRPERTQPRRAAPAPVKGDSPFEEPPTTFENMKDDDIPF